MPPQLPLRSAGHRRDGFAPAVRVLVRSASHLAGHVVRLFALAMIPVHGAAGRTALAAYLQKNPLILFGQDVEPHAAESELLRVRFHE